MSEKQTRRHYTKEFKHEAVQIALKQDNQIAKVASNLGIHPNILHRWMKEFQDDPEHSFPRNGYLKPPDERMRQIEKRLRDAEEERDI
ncbi:MAG: transposase [Candidatus Zhuqueibacterota bacterium]